MTAPASPQAETSTDERAVSSDKAPLLAPAVAAAPAGADKPWWHTWYQFSKNYTALGFRLLAIATLIVGVVAIVAFMTAVPFNFLIIPSMLLLGALLYAQKDIARAIAYFAQKAGIN